MVNTYEVARALIYRGKKSPQIIWKATTASSQISSLPFAATLTQSLSVRTSYQRSQQDNSAYAAHNIFWIEARTRILTAADNVGAEDLPLVALERMRQVIEIPPVARKAVHTDHWRLRRRLPPFGIGDAMKATGTAAVLLFFVHAGSVKQGRIINYHGRGRTYVGDAVIRCTNLPTFGRR
jgi:hypothetical protein